MDRENTTETPSRESDAQAASGESMASRRQFLEGGGVAVAGTVLSTSALSGVIRSAMGPSSKGAPVVVLQGTPDNPIGPERRLEVLERVRDEAVDRGREPPRQLPFAEKAEDSESSTEIVSSAMTVTDDGIPRTYIGQANTMKSTGSMHGSGMGKAKQLAERQNAAVEVHKPDGAVEELGPSDIGKARGAADVRGKTAGFDRALVGTTYAKIDDYYQNFGQRLDAALITTTSTTEDMEQFGGWENESEMHPQGRKVVNYDFYFKGGDGDFDGYGLDTWFWMNPGINIDEWDSEWWVNYAKFEHNWTEGDIGWDDDSTNLEDWSPYSDVDTKDDGTDVSLTMGLNGISVMLSDLFKSSGDAIVDDSSAFTEETFWKMEVNKESTATGTVRFDTSSIAKQKGGICDGNNQTWVQTHEEAGYRKDDGTRWSDPTRDSDYDTWIHYINC